MNNWDDIRFFLAVARAGSVSKASTVLGVNHTTVARRITSLESKHGTRLFDRQTNGYTLTVSGEAIFNHAEEMESKDFKIQRLLYAGDARLSGKLTITMPHDLANFCVIPRLGEFTAQYPDIELDLIVSPGLKDLSAREADIAVRLTPSPPEQLIGKKLADLRHGIYATKRYLKQKRTSPKLIIWKHENQLPAWAKKYYPNGEVVFRVDDLAAMYAAVKAGLGLARMPCYLPDTLQESSIVRLNHDLVPSTWGVWILHHVDLRETQRVKAGKEFLSNILIDQQALFEGKLSSIIEVK